MACPRRDGKLTVRSGALPSIPNQPRRQRRLIGLRGLSLLLSFLTQVFRAYMAGIFISYRREDGSAHAGRLYDRLSSRFGKERVFMDIDTLDVGVDFVEAIRESIASCDVLIAVIGKHWLEAMDEEGSRRIDHPEDFVRLEIGAALERNVRVIPILVGGAHVPRSKDLPDDIVGLSRRNALDLPDLHFNQGIATLITTLEKIVGETDKQSSMVVLPDLSKAAPAYDPSYYSPPRIADRKAQAQHEAPPTQIAQKELGSGSSDPPRPGIDQLLAAVGVYNRTAPPELQAVGTSPRYRNIRNSKVERRAHYGFMWKGKSVLVKLSWRPGEPEAALDVIRKYSGRTIAGGALLVADEEDGGVIRLNAKFSPESGPELIANAMRDLLLLTRSEFVAALKSEPGK
jgi:hypothetical protein